MKKWLSGIVCVVVVILMARPLSAEVINESDTMLEYRVEVKDVLPSTGLIAVAEHLGVDPQSIRKANPNRLVTPEDDKLSIGEVLKIPKPLAFVEPTEVPRVEISKTSSSQPTGLMKLQKFLTEVNAAPEDKTASDLIVKANKKAWLWLFISAVVALLFLFVSICYFIRSPKKKPAVPARAIEENEEESITATTAAVITASATTSIAVPKDQWPQDIDALCEAMSNNGDKNEMHECPFCGNLVTKLNLGRHCTKRCPKIPSTIKRQLKR